jgi:hypothetical protein
MFAPPSDASRTDQASTQLQPGSRVRYWSPEYQENPRIAVVHEFREDEIIVQVEGRAGETQVRLEDIDRLAVSVKPARNNVLEGAMWGSLGLLTAALITLTGPDSDDGKAVAAGLGAAVLVGGGIGALVGWATSSDEQWDEIPLGSPHAIRDSLDGDSLFLTVSFQF